ncbi:hypothetical protein R69927_05621 [Paraburkholderia domus]|uniref:DUF1871 family protein n=1 Tax=Paraburkholderia domus TaxID=2793075 RepID=A0A9N8R967_9BURK|nr:hypothetical protein [Paraburkholderia domus]MBK5066507.1 hypothetical protein [Burkholderia sp. R-70199]MBK5091852.1 hypothetical protein [Burkholderia sp. R-69927]MBK5124788.1 hypothetical protein [Burkholderia sp. R-69980]MBK5170156.1 hypothetical protein [Burkholderia sp. R-70211]MBK5179395.1 hypothetical protein [Burkholderia sp. R-69749]
MKRTFIGLDLDVKKILLKEWDPIGVGASPEADDEYDSYVQDISRMLREEKTVDELYSYLRWIEVEHIGLDGDELHTRTVAHRLMSLDKATR